MTSAMGVNWAGESNIRIWEMPRAVVSDATVELEAIVEADAVSNTGK